MESFIDEVVCRKEKALLEFWRYIALKPKNSETIFDRAKKSSKTVFEIRYIVVDPSARRQGIAKALLQKSIQEAEDQEFKYVRIECTSSHSSRLAQSLGFKCIYKLDYEDYKDEEGNKVFRESIGPHKNVKIYIEELNKED